MNGGEPAGGSAAGAAAWLPHGVVVMAVSAGSCAAGAAGAASVAAVATSCCAAAGDAGALPASASRASTVVRPPEDNLPITLHVPRTSTRNPRPRGRRARGPLCSGDLIDFTEYRRPVTH